MSTLSVGACVAEGLLGSVLGLCCGGFCVTEEPIRLLFTPAVLPRLLMQTTCTAPTGFFARKLRRSFLA